MTPERVVEIYDLLGLIQIRLAEDPRVMGPGYVSRTIQRCRDAEEEANSYYTEVQRGLSELKQELSLKELNRKVRLRHKLMSAEIRGLEIAADERKAHAEASLELEYQAETRLAYERANVQVPAVLPTLEMELVDLQNQIEVLRTLLDCISEKKGSINKTDSAVRLQEKAMETETRVFGGPPQAPTGNGRQPTSARGAPERPVTTDPTWGNLTGEPQPAPPSPPEGDTGTA